MADSGRARQIVCFGPFEADLRAGELRKHGVKVKLHGKSFDVLALLLEHPSEVVTREELRTQLWPADVFVDFDNNLNAAVTKLREALSDSAENPKYVETLPRRGYRFLVPVVTRGASPGEFRVPHPRLAVLPFDNLSGDPAQEYFSDSITEELITELARAASGRLSVIARTSAMRYKSPRKEMSRIGRELDVGYIVEGSVRRAGDHVRVSAQLIQVDGQTHLWAQSYDGELRDALQLQSEISRAIVRQIDVRLSPSAVRTRPVHVEAYDAYLLGLHHFSQASPGGFEKANRCFHLAAERDPQFAPAHAKIAMSHAMSGYFGSRDRFLPSVHELRGRKAPLIIYGGWRNARGEKQMSEQATANKIACSEYQQLFDACESAREILKEHRAEIRRSSSVEEATVDEVLRSQVKYAQAYFLLRNHVLGSLTCQLDSAVP